ncbi:MAG: magnesium transporter CorA family protein [Dermatophilaceae bacterium]|nr:magnesium transporter CorA family protein [Intrasporangiaceae bacterium]
MATDEPIRTTALSCAMRGMAWRDGRLDDEAVSLEELSGLAHDPSRLLWVDLVAPTRADMAVLAEQLGLTQTTIDAVLAPHERPKLVRASDHEFFMTYAVRLDDAESPKRLVTSRISGLVLPHALVTIRSDDSFDMAEVVRRWTEDPALLAKGTGVLLHGLLDAIVDEHFDTIQELDDAIEDLEDTLFEGGGRTTHGFVRQIYGLRKDLVQLRRVVLPMREVVNGVLRHRVDEDAHLSRLYDDLYDHVLRAAEWTESLRDMVTTLFETNLSLQDIQLNQVMRKLAAWAAIIAVPTAVTGWFGQNIPYLGFQEPLGVWLSALLIGGGSGGLWVLFRRLSWL